MVYTRGGAITSYVIRYRFPMRVLSIGLFIIQCSNTSTFHYILHDIVYSEKMWSLDRVNKVDTL